MSKVAVVYWSGTGNTEEMANKVAEGAKAAGAEVEVISADDFDGTVISGFDGVAFGCPAGKRNARTMALHLLLIV